MQFENRLFLKNYRNTNIFRFAGSLWKECRFSVVHKNSPSLPETDYDVSPTCVLNRAGCSLSFGIKNTSFVFAPLFSWLTQWFWLLDLIFRKGGSFLALGKHLFFLSDFMAHSLGEYFNRMNQDRARFQQVGDIGRHENFSGRGTNTFSTELIF